VKAAAAEIFKHAFARARGRALWINFDIPHYKLLRGSYLQKTLLSMRALCYIEK